MRNLLLFVLIPLFLSCGNMPSKNDGETENTGTVKITAWINSPNNLAKSESSSETTWDRLVVQISYNADDTIRDTFDIDGTRELVECKVVEVPVETGLLIDVWTINEDGDTIHTSDGVTLPEIHYGESGSASFVLNPVRGSIILNLESGDSSYMVDSVYAYFIPDDITLDTFMTSVDKASKMFLSIDNIPYGTSGTIKIVGVDSSGDTVLYWEDSLYFNSSQVHLKATFTNYISIDSTVINPPINTVISGILDPIDTLKNETGDLIVTEIMHATNDYEYIEIYNPGTETFNKEIGLTIDGKTIITFKPAIEKSSYYVIGNTAILENTTFSSWTDLIDIDTTFSINKTGGNFITLYYCMPDSEDADSIIDYIPLGQSQTGWPAPPDNRSIILDSLSADPEYNNFGSNWTEADTLIDESDTTVFGTPGYF